jgi:hypothetical protein
MKDREYIIFCDESESDGRYYSNFYGGLLVGSSQYDRITARFENLKSDPNLNAEVKWSNVTHAYLGKYLALMEALFDDIHQGNLKIRIMFRQNAHVATNLTEEQIDGTYFRLYYQFIKHAFGLRYREAGDGKAFLRLYFDAFPAKRESVKQFKGFIHALRSSSEFQDGCIFLRAGDITEIRSHDHVLLQMLDIVYCSGRAEFPSEQPSQGKARWFKSPSQAHDRKKEAIQRHSRGHPLCLPAFQYWPINRHKRRSAAKMAPSLSSLEIHSQEPPH